MKKTFKIFILLFSICLLMTGCFNSNKKEEKKEEEKPVVIEKISFNKLNEIVSNYSENINVDVIDLRNEEDFEEGHIPGAINIPYAELDEIIIDVNREIIVYGDTTNKAKQAAKELISLGYKNVKYTASISTWPYDLED